MSLLARSEESSDSLALKKSVSAERAAVIARSAKALTKRENLLRYRKLPAQPAREPIFGKVTKLCDAKTSTEESLTLEERKALAIQYRPAARKLALSMISKWKCRLDSDELQSVIDLSLCEAAMRFNQVHGAGFMTFLYYHLKGKLIKTIAARADDALTFVDDYEKSRLTTLGEEEQCSVRSTEWAPLSFCDSEAISLDEMIHKQKLVDVCMKACQRLKGVERDVIQQIYFENKELAQVTSELGYSRGHLFRVRMRALDKIRRAVAAYR